MEMHAVFFGKVQGVGFRATARKYALQLGLNGTVRNLADGSVEIYAQGEKETLEEYFEVLRKVFRTSSSQKEFYQQTKEFDGFSIT